MFLFKWIRTFLYLIRRIIWRILNDNITVYSAQATFFLILSTLPFLMVLVSLLRFLIPDVFSTVWPILRLYLPQDIMIFLTKTLNELMTVDMTSIVSLSLLVSLWAASKGIMGLELGMHRVYRIRPRGKYLMRRLRCTLYTLVFVFTIVLAIFLLVFGNAIEAVLMQYLTFFSKIALVVLGVRTIIMVVLFVFVFALGYRYLTGAPTSFRSRLPGVLFSTAGWILFSLIYGVYINNFSNYTYIYGSLGALILLYLWLYVCMIILMLGAEVNVFIRDIRSGEFKVWLDPRDVVDDDEYYALSGIVRRRPQEEE